MSVAKLNSLIEKTSNYDKDERYMATNDLCTELSRDIKIDESLERRICQAILKQLDDSSNDVQSVAVRCLGILLRKVQRPQVIEICDKLCALLIGEKDALRDIYSIGLKTLIADIPEEMGNEVAERMTPRLLEGICKDSNEDVKRECLDNMGHMLRRFGHHLTSSRLDDIMTIVVHQLENDRPVIRKGSAVCLGSLAVVSSDELLNRLVEVLLERIEAGRSGRATTIDTTRTLIQTISTISRTVGYRLGVFLDRLIPLFLSFCGDATDESQQSDSANELREHSFPGLESFILRCPREVTAYIPSILGTSLAFMKYDPNYCYDETDDGVEDMKDDEDFEDGGYDDDDFGGSDDDDTSWKVRKVAVRVISAIISSRPEMLSTLYEDCALELISRFREREENVQLDIFSCFSNLLLATISSGRPKFDSELTNLSSSISTTPKPPKLARLRSSGNFLLQILPQIVRAALKQLSGNSVKTKLAVFHMLRTLIAVLQGNLDQYMPALCETILKCMTEKNQTLKLEALCFLREAFVLHSPDLLQPLIDRILPAVVASANEDWYKVVAESLRLLGTIVSIIRPLSGDDEEELPSAESFDRRKVILIVFDAILPRLEALDIDQEIKDCAIDSAGKLISFCGDSLSQEDIVSVLAILRRRLENDITRMPALKALTSIAKSSLKTDMSSIFNEVILELSLFLKQQSRVLKLTTLITLDSLVCSSSSSMTLDLASALLRESSGLVSDSDLHITTLVLELSLAILKSFPEAEQCMQSTVYPRVIELAHSPLVQGAALVSIIKVLQLLVESGGASDERFNFIFSALIPQSPNEVSRQSLSNLAKCVAGISLKASQSSIASSVAMFRRELQGTNEVKKHLALLCIGEMGQSTELPSSLELKDLIIQCFESGSEETKMAAAYALGYLAVGNMEAFLPVILGAVESSRHQYFLLAALKEVILAYSSKNIRFDIYLNSVLPGLLSQCRVEAEGVRSMVAECLGALLSLHGDRVIGQLLGLIQNEEDKFSRWSVSSAVRFAFMRNRKLVTDIDMEEMGTFDELKSVFTGPVLHALLALLLDSDMEVKKATMMMVNAAVYYCPDIISPHISEEVLPQLLQTLDFRQERIVDLGPFKHKVDDGLPLRKLALIGIESIIDTLPERLNIGAFMPRLVSCLSDKDEIKLQSHQLLCKLTTCAPGAVIGFLDQIIDPLDKTICKKSSKDAPAGPEAERAMDLIRSGVKAVVVINKLEDVDVAQNRRWQEFISKLRRLEAISNMFEETVANSNDRSFEV